jgi:23S rRNA (cytidine1920-2'-O)/16S rRNA (cytidine1409-2'-O)-methyltransferase
LVRRKLATSRSAAQDAIAAGRVEVRGILVPKSATLVTESVSVRLVGSAAAYVSRGGLKLEAGLDAFGLEVAARRALDVGASTGGFTDCLLRRGAAHVVALDVGYGQLAWSLRTDARVTVVERENFRHVEPLSIDAPFDIVVADLSFISLCTVAAALASVGTDATDYVLLIKPQFEVGKADVPAGGVVRDPALRAAAIETVAAGLDSEGIGLVSGVPSPVRGAKGNQEFLVWARLGSRRLRKEEIDGLVHE